MYLVEMFARTKRIARKQTIITRNRIKRSTSQKCFWIYEWMFGKKIFQCRK